MWFYSDKPYKFSRTADEDPVENEDSAAYADYFSDAVQFLLAVVITAIITYGAVILFRPDLWVKL